MHFLYFFWFTHVYHTTGPHVWIYFYLHSPNFTSFLFYLQPHFHSVFCLVFFHLITEFEMDLYDISSPRSQVRTLHFCSLIVWLASISVRPRVNKNKLKEVHQLHVDVIFILFPTSYLPGFYLVFTFHFDNRHTWGILRDFHKALPLKRRFPTFHSRISSFCYHPFF